MSGVHSRTPGLYREADTVLHRLAPEYKIVALLGFVLAVVATPAGQLWAFAVFLGLLAVVAAAGHVPPGWVASRLMIEVPFVLFAVLIPFVAAGPRIELLGLEVSRSGLLDAWNILAKATLGVIASLLLAASTEPSALVRGLGRLRLPPLLVQIASFMLRYADVVTGEMRRMRIARESRGFVARDLRQLPVVSRSAGALFIRSYERGERVHLAMLSRGYTGSLPIADDPRPGHRDRALAAALPVAAAVTAAAAWMLQG